MATCQTPNKGCPDCQTLKARRLGYVKVHVEEVKDWSFKNDSQGRSCVEAKLKINEIYTIVIEWRNPDVVFVCDPRGFNDPFCKWSHGDFNQIPETFHETQGLYTPNKGESGHIMLERLKCSSLNICDGTENKWPDNLGVVKTYPHVCRTHGWRLIVELPEVEERLFFLLHPELHFSSDDYRATKRPVDALALTDTRTIEGTIGLRKRFQDDFGLHFNEVTRRFDPPPKDDRRAFYFSSGRHYAGADSSGEQAVKIAKKIRELAKSADRLNDSELVYCLIQALDPNQL